MQVREIVEELDAASASYAEAILNADDDDGETLVDLERAAIREQIALAVLVGSRAKSADEIVLKTETFGSFKVAGTWLSLADALLASIGWDAAALACAA